MLASLLGAKWSNLSTRIFYRASAAWLGFLTYFFLAAALYSISLFFLAPLAAVFFGRALFILAALVGIYGIIHANNTKVTRLALALPNLPPAWKGRRIVFMSDLHSGPSARRAVRGEDRAHDAGIASRTWSS